jgi:hypothetical protein
MASYVGSKISSWLRKRSSPARLWFWETEWIRRLPAALLCLAAIPYAGIEVTHGGR